MHSSTNRATPNFHLSRSRQLDRVLAHPFWGLFVLIGILGITLELTFSAALPASDWINAQALLPLKAAITGWLMGAPTWFTSMIVEGLLAGVGTVLAFIPVLLVFFTILAVLENSGYLARASRVTDRYFQLLGLPGRACIPLSMGFGCTTSAILGCRIIDERRSRLLATLLVPFVPCTARLAVIAFLTPAFFGKTASWVTWGLVSFNLITLGASGFLANRYAQRRKKTFVPPPVNFPLPPFRMPDLRFMTRSILKNMGEFFTEAGSLIVVFSVITWTLVYFPNGQIEESYLAAFGRWLAPLGAWAGLDDWRFVVAMLSSLVRKENVVAVLGVLFPVTASSLGLSAQVALVLSPAARLAFLVIQMLFIPCAATIATIRQETGSWKLVAVVVALMLTVSALASTLVYQFGSGWLAPGSIQF